MKTVLSIFVLLIALISSAQAQQLTVSGDPSTDTYAVFGETNIVLGQTQFTAGNGDKVAITSLKYKVRECSKWAALATPFNNYTLWTGTTVIPGIESTVDGERVVTFQVGSTVRTNTTVTYTVQADVRSYTEVPALNKQCFRVALERAGVGVDTKTQVLGNFPIRHSAETLVRSKATVILSSSGVLVNRHRTAIDDVAKLTVVANAAYSVTMNEVTIRSNVDTYNTSFQLIDDSTGVSVPGVVIPSSGAFRFILRNPEYISQGSAKVYRIRVNSSGFVNTPNTQDVVNFELEKPFDFQWNILGDDGFNLFLEQSVVPQQRSISYE